MNIIQQSTPQNPILGFVLLASVLGFIVDWRYKRQGGKKPTRTDYLILGTLILIVGGSIVTFGELGYNGEILGMVTVPLFVWIFGIWELSRWRTRNKNPLPPKTPTQPVEKQGNENVQK